MLDQKVIFLSYLILSVCLCKVLCNPCITIRERMMCESFEDLFIIRNLGNHTIVEVTGEAVGGAKERKMDVFICDEPMFERFSSVAFLSLHHARVFHISSDCFLGMNAIRKLYLHNNEITTIEMETFRASNRMKLREIYLNHNYIIRIDFKNIVLPEVQEFKIYNNRLMKVVLKSENMPKIVNMDLGKNYISRFKIESQRMQSLDLSENRIKSFRGSDLILPNMMFLHLNDNFLTTVTSDMLENMPNLRNILLAHNLLHTVSFPSLKLTHFVDLKYNRIKSMENVNLTTFGQDYTLIFDANKVFELESQPPAENLDYFTCNSCFIHIIEPFFFADTYEKVSRIDLINNYLTTLNIFKAYEKDLPIKIITMSYNKIKKIGRKDLSRLPKLESLHLDNNEIAVIANGAFNKLVELDTLTLTNNNLFRLPPTLFEKNPLRDLRLSGNNMAYFHIPGWQEETGEINDSNSTLNNLWFIMIQNNPLQCKCIELIHSWAKKNKVLLTVDDWKVRHGMKPACIVNDQGCKTDVGKDYIKDYWHLFNDEKVNEMFDKEEEDE